MSSGGRRYDIPRDQNITPGEYRSFAIDIYDGNDELVDAEGWGLALFIVEWLSSGNGIDELEDVALLQKDSTITVDGAVATIPFLPPDLLPPNLPKGPRMYFYEFWRTDSGNVRRLSFGEFPVVA